jgi:type V secretory pathway adhesin AidA
MPVELCFNGLPEMNIENIRLENAFITARYGAELSEAKDIVFDNVTVIAEEGPFYILNNVKNFKGVNLYFDKNTTEEVMRVKGSRTSTVELLPFLEDKIEISPEIDKNQIKISQD